MPRGLFVLLACSSMRARMVWKSRSVGRLSSTMSVLQRLGSVPYSS